MTRHLLGLLRCAVLAWVAILTVATAGAQSGFVRPGWLLVAASDYKAQIGRLLVVDPVTGLVAATRVTGIETDVAVTTDGQWAFVSSNDRGPVPRSLLEAVDLSSGETTRRYTDSMPWPSHGGAYSSRLAVSRDNRQLYRYKAQNTDDGPTYFVQVFDIDGRLALRETIALPLCGAGVLLPGPSADTLYVTCSQSQDVRLVKVGAGGKAEVARLNLPGGARASEHLVTSLSADGSELTVIKGDGRFVKTNTVLNQTKPAGAIDAAGRGVDAISGGAGPIATSDARDWLAGKQIWRQTPVVSRDGTLYLLLASGANTRAVRDQVLALTQDSLHLARTIRLSAPAVSITLSAGERDLYAVDTLGDAIHVVDLLSGTERRVITGVGPRPVFAVVVPHPN